MHRRGLRSTVGLLKAWPSSLQLVHLLCEALAHWIPLIAQVLREALQVGSAHQRLFQHFAYFFEGLKLVQPLYVTPEVQVQTAFRLLALYGTGDPIATAGNAAHRFGTAAEAVHARGVCFCAVRALWAHAKAKDRGQHQTDLHRKSEGRGQRVPGKYQAPQVIARHITLEDIFCASFKRWHL